MCIGIPMRVVAPDGLFAQCEGRNGERRIDMALIGPQPVGAWVVTSMGIAQAAIDEDTAIKMEQALEAVALALEGKPVDHLFADLVDREPELPEHLKPGGGD